MRLASALFFFTACSPELVDGLYGCPDGICPEGFHCGSDLLCHRGSAPIVECVVDGHCDDASPCTVDRCSEGRCENAPADGDCYDGDFCNGRDVCVDGACVNAPDATPPCDGCDPTAPLACGCGPGDRCCAGDLCAGAVCVGGTCRACGVVGSPCCLGAACVGPAVICDGGTCGHCGAADEPCCAGRCEVGLECDGASNTCRPPGACGAAVCDPTTEICMSETCVACGAEGDSCCTGGACDDTGLACNFGTMRCESCGKDTELCCNGVAGAGVPPCSDGLACVAERCTPCGSEAMQPCCPIGSSRGRCDADAELVCTTVVGAGTCVTCGHAGEPCCSAPFECGDPAMKDRGLFCVRGRCEIDCGGPGLPCCPLFSCVDGYMCRATMCVPET